MEFVLTEDELQLLRHILRTYPAHPDLHDSIVRLYDRTSDHLTSGDVYDDRDH